MHSNPVLDILATIICALALFGAGVWVGELIARADIKGGRAPIPPGTPIPKMFDFENDKKI